MKLTLQDSIYGVAPSHNRTYENFVGRSGTPVSGVLQSGFRRSVEKERHSAAQSARLREFYE